MRAGSPYRLEGLEAARPLCGLRTREASALSSGSRHGAGRARFWARRVCTQRTVRASSSSCLLDCPGACRPQSSAYREMGGGVGGAP